APLKQEVAIGATASAAQWELKLSPLDQIVGARHGVPLSSEPAKTEVAPGFSPAPSNATKSETSAGNASAGLKPGATKAETPEDELGERANDGFLINGSQVNG